MVNRLLLVVALALSACGSDEGTSRSCPQVQSDAGVEYFDFLEFSAGISPEAGREIADNCAGWTVAAGTGGSLLELYGRDSGGKVVVTFFWLDGVLDSWRATSGWSGTFENTVRLGQSIDEVRELRPAIADAPLRLGYLEERFSDGREVFFHFDIEDRLSIIFVRGRIEGQWF